MSIHPLFIAKFLFGVTVLPTLLGHFGALVVFSDPGLEHFPALAFVFIAFVRVCCVSFVLDLIVCLLGRDETE